jgi:hypothetical protein
MDNDILINQARRLYAALYAKEVTATKEDLSRLEQLTMCAYCRYQRRLNRCVLCYQYRQRDCDREPGKKKLACARRNPANLTAA